VPGNADVWNRVQTPTRPAGIAARLASPLTSLRATLRARDADRRDASGPHPDGTGPRHTADRRRSRLVPAVAGLTAVAVLAGGSAAYAQAHKSVSLDVDGHVRQVSTFAGGVDGLLADAGVDVGARDDVAPAPGSSLADGADVVVRHAHRVTVLADGKEQAVWTTALLSYSRCFAARGDGVPARCSAPRRRRRRSGAGACGSGRRSPPPAPRSRR